MIRSRAIEFLLLGGLIIAFLDEGVRKVLPDQPIYVTAVKDLFFLLAGTLTLLRYPQFHRHLILLLPWVIVTLLSAILVAMSYEAYLLPPAVVRTYAAVPLLMACGLYLGTFPEALRRAVLVFSGGCIAAILVAVLQEYVRDALPAVLSERIYIEAHPLAGGRYNESLFASPTVMAQVIVAFFALVLMAMLRAQTLPRLGTMLMLALAAVFAIYLSRIRAATAVAVGVLGIVSLLSLKTGVGLGRNLLRTGSALALLLAAAVGLAALTEDPYRDLSLERDVSFFMKLLDPQELIGRLTLFQREIEYLPDHSAILGYGAGTGGMLRGIIGDLKLVSVPIVYDTGIALIYHELGIIGLFVFLLCYLGTLLRAGVRALAMPGLPVEVVPAVAIASGYTVWFLFKSHTVIANGFSHMLWWSSLGLAIAAVDRVRHRAWQPQVSEYDPAYALAGYYPDA